MTYKLMSICATYTNYPELIVFKVYEETSTKDKFLKIISQNSDKEYINIFEMNDNIPYYIKEIYDYSRISSYVMYSSAMDTSLPYEIKGSSIYKRDEKKKTLMISNDFISYDTDSIYDDVSIMTKEIDDFYMEAWRWMMLCKHDWNMWSVNSSHVY